jgi:uncharacterized RDD family membrane protein YckC
MMASMTTTRGGDGNNGRPAGPFWVKGDDDEEYGPVDLDELREWVLENRVGIDTPVRIGGLQSDWRPWQTFPELVVLLAEAQTRKPAIALPRLPNHVAAIPSIRILAGLVDGVFIFFIYEMLLYICLLWFVPSYQMSAEMVRLASTDPDWIVNELGILPQALLAGTIFVYFSVFISATGQTPGKRITGLRVVDGQGLTPTLRRTLARSCVQLASIFAAFAGYLPMVMHPQRRALHDLACGTYVMMLRR